MKQLLVVFVLVILSGVPLVAQNTSVFIGAELIDGTGAPPRSNSVIVIEGKTITLVGTREYFSDNGKLISKIRTPKGLLDIPENAGVYEIPGKIVIPGLIDAHVH